MQSAQEFFPQGGGLCGKNLAFRFLEALRNVPAGKALLHAITAWLFQMRFCPEYLVNNS